MADDLISKALGTVQLAQSYLEKRETGAGTEEREGIQDWRIQLSDSVTMIENAGPPVAPHEPAYIILSEQLDLTRQHIEGLHEWHDYAAVGLVIGTLVTQLTMMAGPIGPGWAPPRPHNPGWPPIRVSSPPSTPGKQNPGTATQQRDEDVEFDEGIVQAEHLREFVTNNVMKMLNSMKGLNYRR